MALMAGAVFTACGGDDGDDNGNKPPVTGKFPDVKIEGEVSGSIKAGVMDAIEIRGEGFDPNQDWIMVGYDDVGTIVYERVSTEVLTVKTGRVAFGVRVDAPYLGKTVKVYLDRATFDKMPISGDITFTMPEVAEGFIPDPGFRATLINNNPNVKVLFNALGMIDVEGAAAVTTGDGSYGLNLYGCPANSLEGIELFKGVTGLVPAWDMPNIKVLDLSKWQAKGIDVRCERSAKLEKLICAPWATTTMAHSCPKLTWVDAHKCNWMERLCINESEKDPAGSPVSAVTFLDIRRDMSGTWTQKPWENPSADGFYTLWGGCGFKVADNAEIWIDSWFLWDHISGDHAWGNVYEAWKNRGATIKVYSRVEPYRDELLGTVPMASVDPDALSPDNKNGQGTSANKWKIDDPHTEVDESL